MLLTTTTELTLVALVLVAGWLFGLASHGGGAKWKARYLAERDAHAGYRRDADARVTAAEARHAELERENVRLAKAPPVIAAQPVAQPAATPAYADRAATVIRPTRTDGERRGWFDFAPRNR